MSPLLALAAAALLAAANADDALQQRLFRLPGFRGRHAACAELTMGITPEDNEFIKKVELNRFHADPPADILNKVSVYVPNNAKEDEALVGQRVLVCDFKTAANHLDLNPLVDDQQSPLQLTCAPGCAAGVEIIAEQFVVRRLS